MKNGKTQKKQTTQKAGRFASFFKFIKDWATVISISISIITLAVVVISTLVSNNYRINSIAQAQESNEKEHTAFVSHQELDLQLTAIKSDTTDIRQEVRDINNYLRGK